MGDIFNYDIGDTPVTFNFQMFSAGDFLSEQSPGVDVTYDEGLISSVAVSNDHNIALNELSNITLTVSTPFTLDASFDPALTSLLITKYDVP